MQKQWNKIKLGDISEVIGGGTPSTKSYDFWNGDIPWLTPKDLSGYNNRYISRGERNITKLGLQNSSARMIPKGTVLLTSRAPIGYLAIAENDVCTNQGFKSIILKDGYCPEFFYYLLKNNIDYIIGMGSGSTFAEISGTQVKNLEFTVPPMDIQKKIAGVLSALDDKIELNNKINNNLEQQAQALFKSWFINFEPFGGVMPEDWEIKTLKEVVTFSQGVQVPVQKQITELIDGYEQFIRIVDLTQNNSDIRFIENVDKGKVTYDDIFMIRYGTPGILGRNYKGIIANNLFKIEPINNIISKNYIYNFLNSDFIQNYIKQNAVSSTMPAINFSTLYGQELIIPDAKTLTDYTKIDESMRKQMLQIKFENERLIQLRDTLLPKLMSGEIDVSNVDISALTSTDKLSFTEENK